MIVAMSQFEVANDMEAAVRQAFIERPHLVDKVPGFIRMQVMNPEDNPKVFWLATYWQTREHWQHWYKDHQYKASHADIPKGLKLVQGTTKITILDLFCE